MIGSKDKVIMMGYIAQKENEHISKEQSNGEIKHILVGRREYDIKHAHVV